jgi:outer membrane cobalamin receptor
VFAYSSVRFLLSLSLSLSSLSSPAAVTGVVVDGAGQPLPRARVRVTNGGEVSSTFTGIDGRFRIDVDAASRCTVEASLEGFATATTECASTPLRVTLDVAPIAEHIVVSATRTEAPASQIAADVVVFDRADLDRRQHPLLLDLLRTAPGVAIGATGAAGGVTTLFVRGGESNYTKVLLDGVPLNEPGGAFNLNNITTENLERVEFVPGANSALFGSDAMTGVIQLFTRRGDTATPRVDARVEAGSFGSARASATFSGRRDRVDYSASAARLSTDNDVPNSDFSNVTFSGSAGIRLTPRATVRVMGRAERGRNGVPGQTAFGRPDLDAFFVRHDGDWGVTYDETTERWHQRASYGLAISHQRSANRLIDPPYTPSFEGRTAPFEFSDFPYESTTDLRRHHATYQADLTSTTARAGTHVDTALVDWDGERATLTDILAGEATPASRNNVGVSVQHQALWPRAFATGGVRFEHNASFGNAVVPRASAGYYVRQSSGAVGSTRVSVSAGLGIKEPSVLQTFSLNPAFLGNPDLEPERSRTFDAGVEQRFAADRVRVNVAWFANRYRNIISTRTTSFNPFESQYFNIGLTRARGVETSGDVALVDGVRLRAGYTFLDSKILESTSDFSEVLKAGHWAFRRPRHSGYLQVAWNTDRTSVDVTGSLIGRRVDSDFSSLEPPLLFNKGYRQWDLRGAARLTRQLWITLAVDNLTDREYMEPLGYLALGRAVRIGVKTSFGAR